MTSDHSETYQGPEIHTESYYHSKVSNQSQTLQLPKKKTIIKKQFKISHILGYLLRVILILSL